MNILFLHQNMPGQFKHLAPALARDPANRVFFVTRRDNLDLPGVRRVTYKAPRDATAGIHHYISNFETCVLHGQQVVRVCQHLGENGFVPDLVVAHPGWGESLFVRQALPHAKLLSYCEFFYGGLGSDLDFDPSEPPAIDALCRSRARNAHLLLALDGCDAGLSPTEWQKASHPAPYQPKIQVIFDGVDTKLVRPAPAAAFALPDGRRLTRGDEVVTYIVRNLEPYRGFPSFLRAVPEILRRRPRAQVVIIGGDKISYGRGPADGRTWRAVMTEEVGALDPARVHWFEGLTYPDFLSLLQVSSAHVYLTYPFVLSWSCIEALSAGCVVIGSRTAPVEEVVEDGVNGFLVDFFSPAEIADRTVAALENRRGLDAIRRRARETVLAKYDLSKCLPRQVALLDALMGRPVLQAPVRQGALV